MLTEIKQIEFLDEAKTLLTNKKVEHKVFGVGSITEVNRVEEVLTTRSIECLGIVVKIDFDGTVKDFLISENNLNKLFTFDESTLNELNIFLDNAKKELIAETSRVIKKEREEHEKEVEQAKRQKLEESIERKKQQVLMEVKDFKIKPIEAELDNLYYAIGWLTKHLTKVNAVLPDYLESWFKGKYDIENDDLKVVDSKYRTPAGFPEKWGISMHASFKVKKNEIIPSLVLEHKSKSSNSINELEFIADLIENHNFKFGTKQDVELIKKIIPTEYLPVFEEGFND